ncbi:Cna B-type domain-containing protein, partial [Slackia exigua]|uniref:Cna B-type domain-containing protein n=1 Tax=Slackia exigua TaxID=84109 RepID=UPI0028D3E3B9
DLALSATATIPSGVTLSISDDTTMTGSGKDGITLESGASLACDDGKTLTMSGFKTALIVKAGAEVNDGRYNFDGNTYGFNLQGKFNGTGRDKLTVSALTEKGSTFTGATAELIGCDVSVQAKNEGGEQYGALTMKDASLTTRGVWYYFNPGGGVHLDHSDFYAYKATGASAYKQVMAILADSDLKNGSTLTGDGSRITLSAKMTVDDSKVVIKNSNAGGLNINYTPSSATFTNSTLETTNMRWTPSYGAGHSSGPCSITFQGDCVVNTDAKDKTADDGGANRDNGSSYVVTGGSYLVAYDPGYNHDVTTPTNGAANGDEWLSLFTLADTSVSVLHPINKNGDAYDYAVAHASADGKKHVWTPAAKVTFTLNNTNAKFADGTVDKKTYSTMRGYKLGDVEGNAAAADPGTPVDANGTAFLGWFYKDASGVEHEYAYADDAFAADTEVYAKWDAKTVVYHNGKGESYIQTVDAAASSAKAASFEDVVKADADFAVPGKKFTKWTTAPDGSGDAVAAGATLTFAAGVSQIDLYAQFNDDAYKVAFSANGGTFADSSVFKTNPGVFTIEKDGTGGEVAVLKQTASYGQKLRELLGGVSHNDLKLNKDIASKPGSVIADTTNWYANASGTGDKFRFDEKTFFGFTFGGDNPKITSDTTYYLKWKDDPSVELIKADGTLDSDMWGNAGVGSQKASTSVLKVKADGSSTFSLTGAVDVSGIKKQMEAIEAQFGQDADDFSKIKLTDAKSTFTATFELPAGVTVPSDPQVTDAYLGDCYKVTDVSVSGQKVTVTFELKQAFADYKQLKDAVDSTGSLNSHDAGDSLNTIDDAILLTLSGFTLDKDAVANGDELTAVGAVAGDFSAVAQGSTGKAKRFAFAWKGEQNASGKDVKAKDAVTIQQTMLVKKPYELELGADMLVSALPDEPTAEQLKQAGTNTEHDKVFGVYQGSKINITGTVDVKPVKDQMDAIEAQFNNDGSNVTLSNDMDSSFTAVFKVPEGLTFSEDLSADDLVLEGFDKTFTITNVEVDEGKITVTMGLNKDLVKDAGGTYTYPLLKAAVGKLSDTMKLTIPGILVEDDVYDGSSFTTTGTVEGSFNAVATSAGGTEKDFDFKWKGVQIPEGKDATAEANDNTIQLTVQTPKPTDVQLPADMLVGADTEHTAVYDTFQGSTLDLTGAVDMRTVQGQMAAIEAQFNNPAAQDISVDVKDFGFTATFKIPDGMELPGVLDDPSDLIAEHFGNGFKVESVTADDTTVTVGFSLADPDAIKTYADLKAVVDGAGDNASADHSWMKLTIPGVKVKSDVADNTNLTMTGTVEGVFKAVATSKAGTRETFSFHWMGTQWADGKDKVATDDETIQFTAHTPSTTDAELPADMLVGADTEHDAVYKTGQGSVLNLTGAVDMRTVQGQMAAIEAQFNNPAADTIDVDVKGFGFTATFKVPDGMKLPEGLDASKLQSEYFGSGFKVDSATVSSDGKTLTVGFSLADPDAIKTYADLKAVVDGAGDNASADHSWMKLTIPGVKVATNLAEGTQLTSVGTVDGFFKAIATSQSGTRKAFSFKWAGVQWPDGKDAVAPAGDDSIRLTVELTKAVTSIKAEKVWDDSDDKDGSRPSSVVLHLLRADGTDTGRTLTLDADGDWKGSFDGVPVYDDNGDVADYSVSEDVPEGYKTAIGGDAANGFVVTNSHTPGVTPNPHPNPNLNPDPQTPGTTDKAHDKAKPSDKKSTDVQSTSKDKVIPRTGEANYALGVGIVAIIALAVLAFAIIRRRNKH